MLDEQNLYIRIRLGYIPGTELRPGLGILNMDLGLARSGPRETRISWDWVVINEWVVAQEVYA